MSHPLRKYARHVQRAIEGDTALAMPSYSWCLTKVQEHLAAAKDDAHRPEAEGFTERLKAALVERIMPLARRAG